MADLLKGLLARYIQLFKDKKLEIDAIINIIKEQTGVIVASEEVKMKDGVLYIKTKSKYKLEIILNKDKILEQLNTQGLKVFNLK